MGLKILAEHTFMETFDLAVSKTKSFGGIQCIRLKMACNMNIAGRSRIAKQTEILEYRIAGQTFDLVVLKVSLDSFGNLLASNGL